MNPLRTGMIPPQLPGSPSYLRPGHAGARQVPARSRLQHRRVRQEPSRRPHRRAADRARLPGVLGLSLSPRRDAGRELPRHQQDPDPADGRAAVQEHADPRSGGSTGRGRSANDDLPDASASRAGVQVRRHRQEQTCKDEGPLTLERSKGGRRGNLGQGHRLPRPQRPEEDQQAVLRLVQPGAHARHDRAESTSTWPWSANPAARTGASTKPA